ncbi:MAG: acetate kinase [Candidatus Thiodiazotropha sp.]
MKSKEYALIINCGSSSIKLRLIDISREISVATGLIERIGSSECRQYVKWPGGFAEESHQFDNHQDSLTWSLNYLQAADILHDPNDLFCVCHRIVHGGERFSAPVIVTDDVLNELRALNRLAPLHNPQNLTGIKIARNIFPDAAHVAVFDTAFYRDLPPAAYRYAIPEWIYRDLGVRRYGFHGISHQYMMLQASELTGKSLSEGRFITLHLGNGCSISAIKNGQCVDTSMGMTPLEGLIMGTRCGDLDPTIPLILMHETGISLAEAENLLNTESGLKGICGENDMRAIHRLAETGSSNAKLALEMFVNRIKKYIGSYLAILNGADAIIFSGGIGEHDEIARELICGSLDYLGIELDPAGNSNDTHAPRVISTEGSRVSLLVVPTDEEMQIAKQALGMLEGSGTA